jgi:hypothetical protein
MYSFSGHGVNKSAQDDKTRLDYTKYEYVRIYESGEQSGLGMKVIEQAQTVAPFLCPALYLLCMLFIWRLLLALVMMSFGVYILAKTEPFVRLVGKNEWGERWFGPGGTYTLWKLVGVILSFGAIIVLFWRDL